MKTDRNQLWEEYEDAAFAILMHTVAEQEGEQALQRLDELQQDPSAQLPEEVQRRAEQTIRKTFSAQSRRSARQRGFRILRRVAVAAVVVVLMTVCVFGAFPEARANLYNLMICEYEDHTGLSYTERFADEYASADFTIEPGWLPDGLTLSDEGETYASVYKTYQNGPDAMIRIVKSVLSGGSLAVDTENAEITSITIQEHEDTLIEKEGFNMVLISRPEIDEITYLDGSDVSSDILIQVAENLPL